MIFSARAAVEIAAAVMLVWVLPRVRLQRLLLVGLLLFVAYFVVAALAESLFVVLIAQLARGAAIAVIGTAGLQLFQAGTRPTLVSCGGRPVARSGPPTALSGAHLRAVR